MHTEGYRLLDQMHLVFIGVLNSHGVTTSTHPLLGGLPNSCTHVGSLVMTKGSICFDLVQAGRPLIVVHDAMRDVTFSCTARSSMELWYM